MIKSVTITNYLDESVKINLTEDEPSHGFLIKSIDGLGPPKATISKTSLATIDGSIVNQARVESRNITMTLMFTNAPTIEDTRQRSYKYFPIKKPLTFLIETDNRLLKTIGYIETNTPNIFNKQESNSISIVCDDPYFYSNKVNTTVFFGIQPLFEFPFSNDDSNEYKLEYGSIENELEKLVVYTGDVEVGVTIYIHSIGNASGNITIYNTGTREKMVIDTSKIKALTGNTIDNIVSGDDIIITTMRGNKAIKLFRAGKYINILNAMTKDSTWFTLSKGDNIFAYSVTDGSENLQFKIENQSLYEGV